MGSEYIGIARTNAEATHAVMTDEMRVTNVPVPGPPGIFIQSRRRGRESSPIQIDKVKRRRTVTVKAKKVVEPMQHNTGQNESIPNITIKDFEISELKMRQVKQLKVQSFVYNIMKTSAQSIQTNPLTDFRQFLPENITLTEPSTIYY